MGQEDLLRLKWLLSSFPALITIASTDSIMPLGRNGKRGCGVQNSFFQGQSFTTILWEAGVLVCNRAGEAGICRQQYKGNERLIFRPSSWDNARVISATQGGQEQRHRSLRYSPSAQKAVYEPLGTSASISVVAEETPWQSP